eukprot:scaffold138057_cov30-Prasinocladus_malaysianus.AAC.1
MALRALDATLDPLDATGVDRQRASSAVRARLSSPIPSRSRTSSAGSSTLAQAKADTTRQSLWFPRREDPSSP